MPRQALPLILSVVFLGIGGCCCCPCPPGAMAQRPRNAEQPRTGERPTAVNPLGTGNIPVATDTTGNFHGCPPQGDGGDPWLNQLKNRDIAPATYKDLTVRDLLDDEPEDAIAMGRKARAKWDQEAQDEVK